LAKAPAWLVVAPFLFLLFWSSGFAVAKVALEHAGPFTALVLRFGLAVVLLIPVALIVRPPWPGARALVDTAIVGFAIQVVYFGLSYMALGTDVSAGAVALIVSLQPVVVGILAPRFAGEAVGMLRWVGLGLGLAGAGVVITAKSAVEATSALGLAFAVASLGGMVLGTLYEKRHGSGLHPVTVSLVQFTVAAVCLLPVAILVEDFAFEPAPAFAVAVGYLVLANSFVSLTLLLAMIRHGEVSRVSALFFLVPPMAAVLAWLVLGETMPPLAWLGMAIAVVGVALAARAEQAPTAARRGKP
jgi:drug/metabolite transporter (DMT)-like permease